VKIKSEKINKIINSLGLNVPFYHHADNSLQLGLVLGIQATLLNVYKMSAFFYLHHEMMQIMRNDANLLEVELKIIKISKNRNTVKNNIIYLLNFRNISIATLIATE